MVPYVRTGMPRKISGTATVTKTEFKINTLGGVANFIVLKNSGATDMQFSLSQEDADKNIFWTLAAGATIEWPAEYGSIWVKTASGTTTFEAMNFIRRG